LEQNSRKYEKKNSFTYIIKVDEEKKPAAKKSNYLVEKSRASGKFKDGFAPLLLRAPKRPNSRQSGRQIFRKFFNS
jgi:hypothetical protein